jgi:hypothetical protein
MNDKVNKIDNFDEKTNKIESLEKLVLKRKQIIQKVEKIFLEDSSTKELLPKD